jgi:acylphosphatase
VKNLPTGQVELKAFGRRNEVQALVAFCRVGPPAARVESLDVTWVEYSPCRNGDFHIRYD